MLALHNLAVSSQMAALFSVTVVSSLANRAIVSLTNTRGSDVLSCVIDS